MLSLSLIFSLSFMEFVDYRRIRLEPSLVVDKSRGERLSVEMNITFARVPCYRESYLPPSFFLLASDPSERHAHTYLRFSLSSAEYRSHGHLG